MVGCVEQTTKLKQLAFISNTCEVWSVWGRCEYLVPYVM
jgi:hypothetical protein